MEPAPAGLPINSGTATKTTTATNIHRRVACAMGIPLGRVLRRSACPAQLIMMVHVPAE
jgi:hypothetical protein